MPVRLQWYDDLEAVAARAGDALDRTAQPRLFDRLDWFRMTVRHGLGGQPWIVSADDGEGAAYLFLERGRWRSARPLASWYTLAFRPATTGSGASLLPDLFREAGKRIDRLTLAPVLDRDLAALRHAMTATGWAVLVRRSTTSRTAHPTPPDFPAWWNARPAKLRHTVERRRRSHPLTIEIHRRFSAEAWGEYEGVYRASWKPAEGSFGFLRELAIREGTAGNLRLGIGRDPSGRAVAAQFWLVEGGRATIHKLAHREDARGGSPGSILTAAMFEDVIDGDGVSTLDFGLGDEPYKADWMEDVAPVWRVDAYRPFTPIGALGFVRAKAGLLVERTRAR